MKISISGKRMMAVIMMIACICSTMLCFPKTTKAAGADTAPEVSVLGATLRLSEAGDNKNGTQSVRLGIQVTNADLAKACGVKITINGKTVTVGTTGLTGATKTYDMMNNIDEGSKTVVYAVVIKDVPQNAFETPIEVQGIVQNQDDAQVKSTQIEKNVSGIVNAMKLKYPALGLKLESGVLKTSEGNAVTKDTFTDYSDALEDKKVIDVPLTVANTVVGSENVTEDSNGLSVADNTGEIAIKIPTSPWYGGQIVKLQVEATYPAGEQFRMRIIDDVQVNYSKPDSDASSMILLTGTGAKETYTVDIPLLSAHTFRKGYCSVHFKGKDWQTALKAFSISSIKVLSVTDPDQCYYEPDTTSPDGEGWTQVDLSKVSAQGVTYDSASRRLTVKDNTGGFSLLAGQSWSENTKVSIVMRGITVEDSRFRLWLGDSGCHSDEFQSADDKGNSYTAGKAFESQTTLTVNSSGTATGIFMKVPWGTESIKNVIIKSLWYKVVTK